MDRASAAERQCTAIVVFDYLLTFSDELVFFWRKKGGVASWLFFINRYSLLLALVVNNLPSYGQKVRFTLLSV